MILCTSCGTQNPDHAHACSNCKRKLQSRRNAPVAQNGTTPGAPTGTEDQTDSPESTQESAWITLPQTDRQVDEHAVRMVRSTAEVWIYVVLLIASAIVTAITQQWVWAATGVALAAGLAKMRRL